MSLGLADAIRAQDAFFRESLISSKVVSGTSLIQSFAMAPKLHCGRRSICNAAEIMETIAGRVVRLKFYD